MKGHQDPEMDEDDDPWGLNADDNENEYLSNVKEIINKEKIELEKKTGLFGGVLPSGISGLVN